MHFTRKPARPRQRLQPAEFAAAVDRLRAAGCVDRPGKPAAGERALGPALAAELGLSLRRVRQLLAKARLPPGSKASAAPSPALKAGRMALQRSLGTKVDLLDQRGGDDRRPLRRLRAARGPDEAPGRALIGIRSNDYDRYFIFYRIGTRVAAPWLPSTSSTTPWTCSAQISRPLASTSS